MKNPDGLTIKDLKELLAQYPDTKENGFPNRVYIEREEGKFMSSQKLFTAYAVGDGDLILGRDNHRDKCWHPECNNEIGDCFGSCVKEESK